jgi:hypothetical protein
LLIDTAVFKFKRKEIFYSPQSTLATIALSIGCG